MPRRILASLQILLLFAGTSLAQNASADKARREVGKIGMLGNLTVSMPDGSEYHGTVRRVGADDFAMDEVDQRRELTLPYTAVKKVRAGYGTTRGFQGRRIHPRTRLIAGLAIVGGLLALVFIAVASDHS